MIYDKSLSVSIETLFSEIFNGLPAFLLSSESAGAGAAVGAAPLALGCHLSCSQVPDLFFDTVFDKPVSLISSIEIAFSW